MLGQEVEATLHAGQHSERQAVDLHEAQGIDVVLVPLDHLPVLHRRRLDRHQLVEPVMGEDEAARVLGQVSRRADQLAGEVERQAQPPVLEIEIQVGRMLELHALLGPAPDLAGEHLDQVLGQAERLSDVAQRSLGAVADDGGAERGAVAAIGVVDPLHHGLAPFVLEIDVDVRRLAPLLGNEALEQEVIAVWVDRGDAEDVADGAVGGRAAALAEDALAPGVTDDAVHRQEVGGIGEPFDEPELVLERRPHLVGQPFGVALDRAFPGESLERLLWRHPGRADLVRVLIGELVEREAAAFGDLDGAGQCLRIPGEQPRHLLRRLQVAVGVPLPEEAGFVDGAAVPNAGDDVLQHAAARNVEQHVVGDHGRNPGPRGEVRQIVEPQRIVRPPAQRQGQMGAVAEGLGQAAQICGASFVGFVRHQYGKQALAIGGEVGPVEPALRLARAPLAEGEETAEAAIGWPVRRIDQD